MAGTTRITLIAALIVTAIAACSPPSQHHQPVVVGDSITFALQYSHKLGGLGPEQAIDGCPGRSIHWGRPCAPGYEALAKMVDSTRPGDLVIIEMGTNDVVFPGNYRASIRDMLSLVPKNRCVAWVSVYNGQHQGNTTAFNAIMRQELATRSCSLVIEWSWWVTQVSGLVGSDQIHLTAKGQDVLASLYVQAVRDMQPTILIPPVTITAPQVVIPS